MSPFRTPTSATNQHATASMSGASSAAGLHWANPEVTEERTEVNTRYCSWKLVSLSYLFPFNSIQFKELYQETHADVAKANDTRSLSCDCFQAGNHGSDRAANRLALASN